MLITRKNDEEGTIFFKNVIKMAIKIGSDVPSEDLKTKTLISVVFSMICVQNIMIIILLAIFEMLRDVNYFTVVVC